MAKPIKHDPVPDRIGGQPISAFSSTQDETRRRAYMIYLDRGGEQGCDLNHWLQAQHELREARCPGPLKNDKNV
jgi:hypothetical protein